MRIRILLMGLLLAAVANAQTVYHLSLIHI